MSTIGERLREERDRLGYSQTALGELCGVQKRAQINYEQGVRSPDAPYLVALASVGADVPYVLFGRITGTALSSDEQRVVELYRSATPSVRAAVMAALAAGTPPQRPSADMHVVVHGTVGQQITGGVNAPQTINMGTSRPRKQVP